MKGIKTAVLVTLFVVSTVIHAAASPLPMLETTANQIIDTLKQNKASLKSNHRIIYQAVETHLLPHVDVSGMARSVLGRQAWNKATASEKAEFTASFTRLVIRTYATPLAEYTDEKIKFLPVRGATSARFMRVNSVVIRSNGQNIPLTYSLVAKEGGWKIYDLSVEGVSLLQSFRSQFAQVLQNSNMRDLIAQMNQREAKAA